VDSGVVASLPLGIVLFAGAALFVMGMAAGWWAARSRSRRLTLRAEQQKRQRLSDLLNALPLAALVLDADARIIAQNSLAAQWLKAGGQVKELPLAVDAAVGRVIRSRLAERLELAGPGNPGLRLQVSISPMDVDEHATGALVLAADPGAGARNTEMYQRLTGLIAHELRTPLTAIMGHVEILNSARMDEADLWRRSLGFVAGETERLARLVEDLLSLSRLDRVPVQTQPMNVRAAAEAALSELFEAAERKGVSLVLQAPPELPRVLADPDRIRQVFLNLLDNAIKYAPASTVTVRLTPEDAAVKVEITDTGPGIPSADLPHIFEPFYRSERAAPGARGAGLGLTLVRLILDQHNAPIRAHSLPDQETTFVFSLPASPPSPGPSPLS
jgi:two-component system phosphate regulon sensor histidine kinase PhoR